MVQIVGISDARNNLSKLIQSIKETKNPVVIVQGSSPSVVMYPYDEMAKREEEKDKAFDREFDEMLIDGKKAFKKYLEKNNIPFPKTEEEAYQIIKNA